MRRPILGGLLLILSLSLTIAGFRHAMEVEETMVPVAAEMMVGRRKLGGFQTCPLDSALSHPRLAIALDAISSLVRDTSRSGIGFGINGNIVLFKN
ncbi:hypothetical protein SASPL_153317 [Salvia splendens]|uniref:Dirigent protein n=1 Tax=Salvia splendens TaxID=180675 RepID=A0A8X8W4R3_SALSN|nr:hypothetical protein SASPL_153317 [Salvia splendens]